MKKIKKKLKKVLKKIFYIFKMLYKSNLIIIKYTLLYIYILKLFMIYLLRRIYCSKYKVNLVLDIFILLFLILYF